MTRFLLWLLTAVALARPPLFEDLSFEEARARAAAQNKYLLVDATASWCHPCRQMDATTWLDPRVATWCKEHAVAIQVDVNAAGSVAEKLGIRAMPTLVLFAGEKELDRLEGYREPAALLDWFQLVAAGRKESDRTVEKALQGDLEARLEWADTLVRDGRSREALEQLLWLWDHMLEKDPSLFDARAAFFQAQLGPLLKTVPEARPPLAERYRALGDRILAGAGDLGSLHDWLTLSEILDGGRTALEVARQLPEPSRLRPLERRFFALLVRRGDWKEAGSMLADPLAEAELAVRLAQQKEAELPAEVRPRAAPSLRKATVATLLNLHHACVAAGRQDEALRLEQMILDRDGSEETRRALGAPGP